MKTILLFLLTIFISKGCSSQAQNDLKNTVLEYTANTRGFYMKIVVKDKTVTVSRDRSGNDKPIVQKVDDADWRALVDAFMKIDLDKLADYNDPTQKRFYDGAAIGSLSVFYKDKAYNSKEFDHGTPPVEIESFIKILLAVKDLK